MKKTDIRVQAKVTKAKESSMRLVIEIKFDELDSAARERAADLIARITREVLPAERIPEVLTKLNTARESLAG
jgi:chromatin remodeling complex protein RSC6